MRTTPVETFRAITIVAQHLNCRGKVVLNCPTGEAVRIFDSIYTPLFRTIIVDMIERKELNFSFSAAATASAIPIQSFLSDSSTIRSYLLTQDRPSYFVLPTLGGCFSLVLQIFLWIGKPMRLPSCLYLFLIFQSVSTPVSTETLWVIFALCAPFHHAPFSIRLILFGIFLAPLLAPTTATNFTVRSRNGLRADQTIPWGCAHNSTSTILYHLLGAFGLVEAVIEWCTRGPR